MKASTSSIRGLKSFSFSEATLDRSAFLRSQSAISCSTETFCTISSRDFSVTPMSSRSRRLKPGPNAVVILFAQFFHQEALPAIYRSCGASCRGLPFFDKGCVVAASLSRWVSLLLEYFIRVFDDAMLRLLEE